jgi:hypothetical protein
MAAITAAVAVGAIAAGAAVYSGMEAKGAAKDAARAQHAGYDAVQYVDIDKLNDKSLGADSKRFEEQFKLQEKFDPTVAGLRKGGAKGILDGLGDDADANALLQELTKEGADSPRRQALIDKLYDGAEAELNAGATLPPEFQQELVRAGLEKTGNAGTVGSGAAGVEARTILGRAGLDLQAHRRSEATKLLSTADVLKQNRAAILANTLGAVEATKNQRQGRFINAYQIGAAGVPQAGLTGADVANLDVANLNLKNQVVLGKAGVNANLAIAKGQANQQMIAGVASGLTTAVGGVGGGAGGGGGIISMFGGGGGMGSPGTQNNPYGYSQYGRGTFIA